MNPVLKEILEKFTPKKIYKRHMNDFYYPRPLPPEKVIKLLLKDNPELRTKFNISSPMEWRSHLRIIRQKFGTNSTEYKEFSEAFQKAEYKIRNCGVDLEYPKIITVYKDQISPLIDKGTFYEHKEPWYDKENEQYIHIKYLQEEVKITDEDRNKAIYDLANILKQ